jgi:predicted O-methyltransferase YrrM
MEPTTVKEYVPWQTPRQNDERVQAIRERLAAQRGVPVTKVSKSGDVLAYLLDMTEAAELLNIQPAAQAQP